MSIGIQFCTPANRVDTVRSVIATRATEGPKDRVTSRQSIGWHLKFKIKRIFVLFGAARGTEH